MAENKNQKAFTLIELLVVIGIFIPLCFLSFPFLVELFKFFR